MKKDRNRPEAHKPDLTLPRSKILRGRKNFRRLFEKSTVLNSKSLQFRYRIYSDPEEGRFIGFAAPKKNIPKAVKRNRIKRILREAYRLNQSYLQEIFAEEQFGFHGLFLAKNRDLSFAEIEEEMISLLTETKNRLLRWNSANTPPDSTLNADHK
jgi:ribonuclease P protein component